MAVALSAPMALSACGAVSDTVTAVTGSGPSAAEREEACELFTQSPEGDAAGYVDIYGAYNFSGKSFESLAVCLGLDLPASQPEQSKDDSTQYKMEYPNAYGTKCNVFVTTSYIASGNTRVYIMSIQDGVSGNGRPVKPVAMSESELRSELASIGCA